MTPRAARNSRPRRERPPLDAAALDRLALFYAGRYATTRARLAAYLERKLRERGWAEERPAPVAALVERFAGLGYVDDKAYADARGAALGRRGYGARRLDDSLRAAGVGDEDAHGAREAARDSAFDAALHYARRRRIGPFAAAAPDRAGRQKALASMLRAGHPMDLARAFADAPPGEVPPRDD